MMSKLMLLAVPAAALPSTCHTDQADAGQRQVWVPGCSGPGCKANGEDHDCAWCVYDMPKCKGKYGAKSCENTRQARAKQNAVCYQVHTTSFEAPAGAYQCQGTETLMYYPEGKGPFPVVVYAHGMGDGGNSAAVDGREYSLDAVATRGFVVLAPYTGGFDGKTCSSKLEYKDVLQALNFASVGGLASNAGLPSGIADWSSVGVWGFSMGGKTIPLAAAKDGLGIKAMVAEHGARSTNHVHVPSMLLTSSLDSSSSPPDLMKDEFNQCGAKDKVFANLNGFPHEEPTQGGRMDIWVSKFFSCHLGSTHQSAEDCCDVYGDGPHSLCTAYDFVDCIKIDPSFKGASCHASNADAVSVLV